ncbi:hypothetical protein F0562_011885 [Nyssa sinensis]|uniref:GAGA-binding transcriptional activator n=1 Tax=Nyssa sinensis TaxID=561372 RepID=A0A5J4ZU74_9ASTE|nr:hypothetical protein F0562_011885 [Nyssa sinensis]
MSAKIYGRLGTGNWKPSGSFFSATKIGLNAFQATKMDPKPALAAVPICSVAPMTEPTKNSEFDTKPTKVKKRKPSAKSSSQIAPKVLRPKQPKKKPSGSKKARGQIKPGTNVEKKNLNIVFDKPKLDFSAVPSPYCSCTGVSRGCYKAGSGGWQSSCCNTSLSEYPLPMSSTRPGVRVGGRKMSNGAYGKLLHRLAVKGHDLCQPVDLKDHWAKHGTNKFVTIK